MIAEALRRHADREAERPALIATGLSPLSYGELLENLTAVRSGLACSGFDTGARIVVALPNGPLAALAVVAFACSAVAVPLNTKLALPEVDQRLRLLRPSVRSQRGSRVAAAAGDVRLLDARFDGAWGRAYA